MWEAGPMTARVDACLLDGMLGSVVKQAHDISTSIITDGRSSDGRGSGSCTRPLFLSVLRDGPLPWARLLQDVCPSWVCNPTQV